MSKIIERYIITSAWQHYHSPDSLLFNTFINESLFLSLQPEHQRDGSNSKAITRPSGHTFTLDYWPSHPSLKSLVTNCINSPSFRHLICILKMHAPQPQKSFKKKAATFPALRKLFIQSRNAIKYTSSDSIETCPCSKGYDCISMTKVK